MFLTITKGGIMKKWLVLLLTLTLSMNVLGMMQQKRREKPALNVKGPIQGIEEAVKLLTQEEETLINDLTQRKDTMEKDPINKLKRLKEIDQNEILKLINKYNTKKVQLSVELKSINEKIFEIKNKKLQDIQSKKNQIIESKNNLLETIKKETPLRESLLKINKKRMAEIKKLKKIYEDYQKITEFDTKIQEDEQKLIENLKMKVEIITKKRNLKLELNKIKSKASKKILELKKQKIALETQLRQNQFFVNTECITILKTLIKNQKENQNILTDNQKDFSINQENLQTGFSNTLQSIITILTKSKPSKYSYRQNIIAVLKALADLR